MKKPIGSAMNMPKNETITLKRVTSAEYKMLQVLRRHGPMNAGQAGSVMWNGNSNRRYALPAASLLHRMKAKGLVVLVRVDSPFEKGPLLAWSAKG